MAVLTANDTFIINDIPIDLADGDTSTITYPNDLATMKTGKNKVTLYAKNEGGSNADVVLRVPRGGTSDKYLNGLKANQDSDFIRFPLMNGASTKRLGDGDGNVTFETIMLIGGIFKKNVDSKENVDGDTEQAVAVYNLQFSVAPRALS